MKRSKNKFAPAGLSRLLDKAGDDIMVLQTMMLVMDRLIARRNELEKLALTKKRKALPTSG